MRVQRKIQKPVHDIPTDGFLTYGKDVPVRNPNGKQIGKTFVNAGKLAFSELSARDQDYQYAGAMGASLDLKVKTYCPPSLQKESLSPLKCVIDGIKYDVIKADRGNGYIYFYLQKVGGLNE